MRYASQAVGCHECLAAGGDEHRVDDEVREAAGRSQFGHDIDDAPGGQHPGLDAPDVEVVEDGLDLQEDEPGFHGGDAAHLGGVLRGHRRQRRCPVYAVCGECLQVGLRPGAPPSPTPRC